MTMINTGLGAPSGTDSSTSFFSNASIAPFDSPFSCRSTMMIVRYASSIDAERDFVA